MSQLPPPLSVQPAPQSLLNYYAAPGGPDPWPGLMRCVAMVTTVAAAITVVGHGGAWAMAVARGKPLFPHNESGRLLLYSWFSVVWTVLGAVWLVGGILLLARSRAARIILLAHAIAQIVLIVAYTTASYWTTLSGLSGTRSSEIIEFLMMAVGSICAALVLPALIVFLMTRPRTKSYLCGQ